MRRVRLGAVSYLNARPLVEGLDRAPEFRLEFDLPSRCATRLHEQAIDLGLIPSIEYWRSAEAYLAVPDLAITSRGPVASVAIFTKRPLREVRVMALDTSSRTSVALTKVLGRRTFGLRAEWIDRPPDPAAMLLEADATLIIGDTALLVDVDRLSVEVTGRPGQVEKVDLGEQWTLTTGLPFVWAIWAGRPGAIGAAGIAELQRALARGLGRIDGIVAEFFGAGSPHHALGVRYLRDNIHFHLGPDELAGAELFCRYAAEAGVVPAAGALRFFAP
jgi:chorismate dehydratase